MALDPLFLSKHPEEATDELGKNTVPCLTNGLSTFSVYNYKSGFEFSVEDTTATSPICFQETVQGPSDSQQAHRCR